MYDSSYDRFEILCGVMVESERRIRVVPFEERRMKLCSSEELKKASRKMRSQASGYRGIMSEVVRRKAGRRCDVM